MTARLASLPIVAVMAGTTFVAVTAFVLAYDGSRGAATDAGISQAQWYPFCIEGVIVCASVATLRLHRRVYPWLILLSFTAVSVAANVLHAWEQPGWQWWSLAFAAVPPLALPICVHLLLMVGRGDSKQAASDLNSEAANASGVEVREEVADAGGSGAEERPDPSAPDPLFMAAQALATHNGGRISRRDLIAGLRERGHKLGTKRADELLKQLRERDAA